MNFCKFPRWELVFPGVPAFESPAVFVEMPKFGVYEEMNFTLQGRAEVHLKMKSEGSSLLFLVL